MKELTLVFPHQLFREHPALKQGRDLCLIEEWLFFNQYAFHKQKLVLHRASMKWYQQWLTQQGYRVKYIESAEGKNDVRKVIAALAAKGVSALHIADVTDEWLKKRIEKASALYGITLHWYNSPYFLNTMAAGSFFDKRKTYFQTDFYIHQRKLRNILIANDGAAVGGSWSYDADNRKRFPKTEMVPAIPFSEDNEFLEEARAYVATNFADNYGSVNGPHLFAISHDAAEKCIDDFIQHRFAKFGDYEDAIVSKESVLYHSILSPMINTGLITPQQILKKVFSAKTQHAIPLNSLEGFVRQIIGWREFIRIVYEREGTKQRTKNYWQFTRKIPRSFWKGETGIAPVDLTIKKILQHGYSHHIERLMVLGNFMLLCEFDPDDVYRWFMEMYIDAYDWVMVPNVYGMTQFADGGLMTTKPYISGSNYLMKMGDYPKGKWQEIWDALFWRFMHVQRHFFERNPRLSMLLRTFDKWPADKRNSILQTADNYLQTLDNGIY